MNTSLLLALLAVVFSPLLAYIGVARRLSGRITTSDASELWKESTAIRQDYAARLRQSDARILELEQRVQDLEARERRHLAEIDRLKREAGGVT